MDKPQFKEGDWCFCDYKLKQIKKVENGKIVSVTDGYIEHSGSDLSDRCFPLDITIKALSDNVQYWSDKFHSSKVKKINHPDLNRELIKRWVGLCNNKDDMFKIEVLTAELNAFGQEVLNGLNALAATYISGIRLIR